MSQNEMNEGNDAAPAAAALLRIGVKLNCRWRDGTTHLCEVIEKTYE